MSSFLQLLLALALILLAAKTAGYLSTLVKQPSVLGELLVGLLLGPSLINLLHWPVFTDHVLEEMIAHLAELGVLLLMFVAGLELHFSELLRNSKVSAFAGMLGVVIPVGLGWGIGLVFGLPGDQAVFLGLALGATSVSISAQTLMELKALRSRVGLGLLGAAVFDDILVILLVSSFLALQSGTGGVAQVALIFVRMLLFIALSVLFGTFVLPRLVKLVAPLPISQGIMTLALVVLLVYGLAAEVVGGMAAITGSFLAGLMFARSPEKERIERGISALSYGFLVPIFFVHIGLTMDIGELKVEALWMLLAVTVIAIAGKLFGAGVGAKLAGFTNREAVQLGAGMVSRGEVGLIIATVGINEGLVDKAIFSTVVGMVLITTLITPIMLRALFARTKAATQKKEAPIQA